MTWETLKSRTPFPPEKPPVQEDLFGWGVYKEQFLELMLGKGHETFVEVGVFLGVTTRWLLEVFPKLKIIAIDHWKGSSDFSAEPSVAWRLPDLYERFVSNVWDFRDRIVPMKRHSVNALWEVKECGILPDIVYIDAEHTYDSAKKDIDAALDCFPNATICGDDYSCYPGVGKALNEVCAARRISFRVAELAMYPNEFWVIER